MSTQVNDECKDELVHHLSSAVKQVQMEYLSAGVDGRIKPCITNNSPAGRILFSCLEMILCHGLKRHDLGVWHAVEYFCRNDVKRTLNKLAYVKTNRGKSRAWVYLTLNEGELEGYFQSFQTNVQHFYKFYARSALVCSGQDVSYLDSSIMCGKNWRKDQSCSNATKIKATNDRGSVVHIDTKSISEVGQKAVGLIKGIVSQENSSSSKSMKDIDPNMLVAVNSNQRHMQGKKYCPDCGNPNELICLCDRKEQKPVQTVRSENAEILQSFLQSNTSDNEELSLFQEKRINPFDSSYMRREEIEMSTRTKRFDLYVPVTDSPIKVQRKPRKRRKKLFTSVSSANSEDVNVSTDKLGNLAQKCRSHDDICLSNPLIGFDPGSDEHSHSGSEFSLLNVDGAHEESIVFVEAEVESNNVKSDGTCSKDNALTLDINTTLNPECILSCQNRSVDSPIVEILTVTEEFVDIATPVGACPNMESSNVQFEIVDANENAENDGGAPVPGEDFSPSKVENVEVLDTDNPLDAATVHSKAVEKDRSIGSMQDTEDLLPSHNSSINSEVGSQLSTPVGSCNNIPMSSQSTPIKRTANDFATSSDCDDRMVELNDERKELDVRLMSPQEKKDFRKMKSATRYRSQSEKLLEDLTKLEVERLRAEVEARLKPSRDKLERVQKYILERSESVEIHPTATEEVNNIPPTSNVDTCDISNINVTIANTELSPSDNKSALTSLQDTTDSMQSNTAPNFKAVANIDNTLRLYLMLEILVNENEEMIKMFHLSTGHSEGNWTALYLLFSDSCVYFLRSGDGNCPYQPEHAVPYADMDYASVGSHDQTIEFVFYKTKKSTNPRKQPPSRYRAKVLVDACDADLTNLLISTLSEAVAAHTRRWGSIKVCPPVFRDAREHEISLVKYLRSEGLTGNIQYYQLVHWEDPDFVKGASVAKFTMQGTLKYKTHSFWGSSTKSAYFVLSGGLLYRYANRESEKPDCCYELTGGTCVGCRRIKASDSANSAGLDFVIDFQGDSKLELSGFSIMEVTEWLQCLCMIVSLDQSSRIDQQVCTDGIVMNMLNHDALVPCGLIIADETLLLCHEDHHTGFCRTLATAKREDIQTINIDRTGSIMCELVVEKNTKMPQTAKWGIFFPRREQLQEFLNVVDAFSKAPCLCEKDGSSDLTHYLEARALLDSRWTRTDNLLKGRSAGSESYTFV